MASARNNRFLSVMSNSKTGTKDLQKDNSYLDETLKDIRSLRYKKYNRKPWKDALGNSTWSISRIRAAKIVLSQAFETCMGFIIIGNMCLIVYEADQDAMCYPQYAANYDSCPYRSSLIPWLAQVNIALLALYSVECTVRWYVERCLYFHNLWNMIDLMTVVLGWAGVLLEGMVNLSLLRLCRVVRIARAARVLISIPEFYLLITGLYSSVKAIVFGSFILLAAIIVWAIIAVEVLHPYNSLIDFGSCERCPVGFASVFAAALTLFQQIVAGDAWGEISVPLVMNQPWAAGILFAILMSVSLGVMNLILAVIVERAAEAQNNDQEQKIKVKDQERVKNMEELAKLCASLDDDANGLMSLEEILKGYDSMAGFQKVMEAMDIRREEIETIFNVLDSDNTGAVPYLEFCTQLGGFRKRDPIVMHSIVEYKTMQLQKLVQQEVLGALQQQTSLLREQHRMLATLTARSNAASSTAAPPAKFGRPLVESKVVPGVLIPDPIPAGSARTALPPMPLGDTESMEIFERLEQRMMPLLAQAEELAQLALARRAEQAREDVVRTIADAEPSKEQTTSEGCDLDDCVLEERKDVDETWMLEERFAEKSRRFQQRLLDADALMERCSRIVESLTTLKSGLGERKTSL